MPVQRDTNGQPDDTSRSSPIRIQTVVPERVNYGTPISGVSAGLSTSAPAGPPLSPSELPPSRPASAMSDSWSTITQTEHGSPAPMEMPAGTMSPLPLTASPYAEPFPVLPSAFDILLDLLPPPLTVDDFEDRFPTGTSSGPGASSSSWKRDSEVDRGHDEERKHIQHRLLTLEKRLDQEQKKIDEMLNSGTAETADVEVTESVAALLRKKMMQERAKLAKHHPQLPRQPQHAVPQWLPLTEPPSGNGPQMRAGDHRMPEPDRGGNGSDGGNSHEAHAGDQQVGEPESDRGSNISGGTSPGIWVTPEASGEDDQPGERDTEDNGSSSDDNGTGNASDASVIDHHASESDKQGSTFSTGSSSTEPNKFSWADDSPFESEAADSPKIDTSPKSSSPGSNELSWAGDSPPVSEPPDSDAWAVGLDIDKEAPTGAPVRKVEHPIEKKTPINAPIPKPVLSWAQVARRGMEKHPTRSLRQPVKPDCPVQGSKGRPASPSGQGSSSDASPHDTPASGDEPSGGQSSSESEPDKGDSKNEEKKTAESESAYAQNTPSSSGSETPSAPGEQSKKKDKNRKKKGSSKGKQEGEEEKKEEVEADWTVQDWPEQDQGTW
ncbi:uncharacterized protein B0T15DRAFT_494678 [Chaetomium strumarium]|uniref:Uncharacterized protein n=1 Tax=Chaetomium strumarium TaxID=1170767 RepID=A0AAJ0GQD4_9PEZI|nr:hypothetical protein B0T15DRAFT_494678 [Chaetomium strumarium]